MGDKMVWVKATARGQLEDRTWVDETSAPFQVAEEKVSKRWMKPLTSTQAKKLKADAITAAGDDVPAAEMVDIMNERDELLGKVESLEADLSAMTAERDKMNEAGQKLADDLAKAQAPPIGSVAGAKKS